MKVQDGGPIKTFGWQLAKAVVAAIVVVVYSRSMGAYGRGALSILLLNLQLVLMVSELFAGGALANLLSTYPPKRILPSAWLFLLLVLVVGYVIGWFGYVLPNQGNLPLDFDHPNIINLNLLFFQGLFLGSLGIQYNLYQVNGWIQQRNKLQLTLEVLKLLGVALCFEAMYGFVFPKMDAIELSRQSAIPIPADQTQHYVSGFNETAVLWILVYASGLVCLISLGVILKQRGAAMNAQNDNLAENNNLSDNHHLADNNSIWPPKELFTSGFMSQTGHILLFLLYRLPLWWMAAEFGNAEAGVLANALLMADTLWIFGNSFGTILHSRMLRWGPRKAKFGKLLSLYVLFSGLGTLFALVVAWLVPPSVYVWVFGSTFTNLKETFALISPAVLFLGLSAPIGHFLHAQNRFLSLIFTYGIALLVLLAGWKAIDQYLMYCTNPQGLMSRIMCYVQSYLGKLMMVNLAFFVLFLCNYLQVRKDIKWEGISLLVRRLLKRTLAK